MQKEAGQGQSTGKCEEVEIFHEVWENMMQRVLSVSFIEKLGGLCKVDKTKMEKAGQLYQSGVNNALKGVKRRLKQLAEKYNFVKAMHEASSALNFNLLVAELLRVKELPYTEEELYDIIAYI